MIKYKKLNIGEKMTPKVVSSTDDKKLLAENIKNLIGYMSDKFDWIDSYVELEPDWEFDWSKDKESSPRGAMITFLVILYNAGFITQLQLLNKIQEDDLFEIDEDYLLTIDELKEKYPNSIGVQNELLEQN